MYVQIIGSSLSLQQQQQQSSQTSLTSGHRSHIMEQQVNRPHRPSKEKKKKKRTEQPGNNPKAFAFSNPGKLRKQAVRSHDIKEKRLHVPMVDRTPEEAPPLIVAVVGPPGTGKTTLIKSLVKRYTKHTLTTIQGPITVVTGKRRRLTFIECNNDINSMIDLAKIADIVLLMIDGNFGFEMETMEFLNILAPHGLPSNIFGILTHLDLFKSQSILKTTKKRLKHRFWSELYQGAKLFYLSGVMNGRYPDREIHNLSRFISVMKNPRPLRWRNEHYYVLADRIVDLTDPAELEKDHKIDREVALYGWVHGQNFPAVNGRVHVPGVGDLSVASVEQLPDPCPTPFQNQQAGKAKRRLGEKQKLLYAPMSDVGGVLVDKDAVYVDMPSQTFKADELGEEAGMGERLVVGLQQGMRGKDVERGVQLFAGGQVLTKLEDDEVEEVGNSDTGRKTKRSVRLIEKEQEDGDDEIVNVEDDDEDDDENEGFNSEDEQDDVDALARQKPGRTFRYINRASNDATDKDKIEFADSDSDLGSISGDEDGLSLDNRDIEDDSDVIGSDDDDAAAARWKRNLAENARKMYTNRKRDRIADLARMIYDESLSPADVIKRWRGQTSSDGDEKDDPEEDDDGDFFKKVEEDDERKDIYDRGLPFYDLEALNQRWSDQDELEAIRKRFITASLFDDKEAAGAEADGAEDDDWSGIGSNNGEDEDGSDSEGDGAFEDLETGEIHGPSKSRSKSPTTKSTSTTPAPEDALTAERDANARKKAELRLRFEEEDREGFNNSRAADPSNPANQQEFDEDDWYLAQKAKLAQQTQINRTELSHIPDESARIRAAGHPAGSYIKIVLSSVPREFMVHFNPHYPVIVGGLTQTESRFGFIQVRIKRHRWHKKILKTNDPLIFSLGWRRFQAQPIYSISDSRTRNRMLKYTPEHMHCFGTFYGPLIDVNTGFCAVQTLSNDFPGFRVAATGVVLSVDHSVDIVKKLKLTGVPVKIFKNTAFIRDMFTSALEIAKFEGAGIRTVSGIRGQIKRALARPEGHFRATFEDRILMSDIVFLRGWYPVKPSKYYNPVTNLLLAVTQSPSSTTTPSTTPKPSRLWEGMRLTSTVRHSLSIPIPNPRNSRYPSAANPLPTPLLQRPTTRHFNPLKVPKSLQRELPFANKLVQLKPRKKDTYLSKRQKVIVVDREERKARDVLQKIVVLAKEKREKRKEKEGKKREGWVKKVKEGERLREERERREKQEFWKKEGRKRGRQDQEGGAGKKVKI